MSENGKVVQNEKTVSIGLRVNDTRAYQAKAEGSAILIGID